MRDFAEVRADGAVDVETARDALALFEVDELGLDKVDRAILQALCETFRGQPVGLSTLAVAVAEEPETVEDVYEPFLLKQGLLLRTPRGRVATPAAYAHLGLAPPASAAARALRRLSASGAAASRRARAVASASATIARRSRSAPSAWNSPSSSIWSSSSPRSSSSSCGRSGDRWRPTRRLIASVDVGDEVVTRGRLRHRPGARRRRAEVEIAPGVVVTVARGAIAAKLDVRTDDGEAR